MEFGMSISSSFRKFLETIPSGVVGLELAVGVVQKMRSPRYSHQRTSGELQRIFPFRAVAELVSEPPN
jgi:hypothetical protein